MPSNPSQSRFIFNATTCSRPSAEEFTILTKPECSTWHEPVAGAIEGVTSAQDAPLDGHLLCQELEDVARRLGWMRSIEWEASGAGGAGRLRCAGQVHADVPPGWMKFSLGVRREPSRNATRRCATLGKRIVTGRLL
jgi:hypothetical protein